MHCWHKSGKESLCLKQLKPKTPFKVVEKNFVEIDKFPYCCRKTNQIWDIRFDLLHNKNNWKLG